MVIKGKTGESKIAMGTQLQTSWAPWIRDLAEMLENSWLR
jgi:hypothetical protein